MICKDDLCKIHLFTWNNLTLFHNHRSLSTVGPWRACYRIFTSSTIALEPRADVTRSPKQGYQWQERLMSSIIKKKIVLYTDENLLYYSWLPFLLLWEWAAQNWILNFNHNKWCREVMIKTEFDGYNELFLFHEHNSWVNSLLQMHCVITQQTSTSLLGWGFISWGKNSTSADRKGIINRCRTGHGLQWIAFTDAPDLTNCTCICIRLQTAFTFFMKASERILCLIL